MRKTKDGIYVPSNGREAAYGLLRETGFVYEKGEKIFRPKSTYIHTYATLEMFRGIAGGLIFHISQYGDLELEGYMNMENYSWEVIPTPRDYILGGYISNKKWRKIAEMRKKFPEISHKSISFEIRKYGELLYEGVI